MLFEIKENKNLMRNEEKVWVETGCCNELFYMKPMQNHVDLGKGVGGSVALNFISYSSVNI